MRSPMSLRLTSAIALSVTVSAPSPGCPRPGPVDAPRSAQHAAPVADRAAILAMAGAFHVDFRFEETVAAARSYELAAPYTADAIELVVVVADEADFISLQHVLVVETGDGALMVVKHWRQDWRYEDPEILAYRGHASWRRERHDARAVRGTWTQAVFQTTDAPRYEARGRWTHVGHQSSWESETTWRPLPRRERHRDDYDVIACRNRHTLTPDGWVHEQDNRKLVVAETGSVLDIVAHETGLNRYRRIDDDAVAAAAAYWSQHAGAWAEVRAAWSPLLDRERLVLRTRAGDRRLSTVVDTAIEDPAARAALPEALAAFVME